MILKEGDFLSGSNIAIGKYLGTEEIDMGGLKTFYKLYDAQKQATHFVIESDIKQMRKLPSKGTVLKHLNVFSTKAEIDCGEIEGSRYNFFKVKLEKSSFKNEIEVFHDLLLLKSEKKTSIAEAKLLSNLKEKLMFELAHILALPQDEVDRLISFTH